MSDNDKPKLPPLLPEQLAQAIDELDEDLAERVKQLIEERRRAGKPPITRTETMH
jgi:hypothetical protein